MSLTGFLTRSSDIRAELKKAFPFPHKSVPFPALQAPPLTTNYALVGQAFDYLLRFYIERHNSNAPKGDHWVADFVRGMVYPDVDDIFDEKEIFERYPDCESQKFLYEQVRVARKFLKEAHQNHETYLSTGEVTDDLLRSCLDLAIIDGLVRAHEMRGSLGKADHRDLPHSARECPLLQLWG